MISISRLVSTTGTDHVQISTKVDHRDGTARITRTATLDGGVYINYQGVADGDRTIQVEEFVTAAQADIALDIYRDGEPVRVSIPDGVFIAAIQSCAPRNSDGKLQMRILIDHREA